MITKKLYRKEVIFGCDPEFFFEKKGKIIGSEKIIDRDKGFKVIDAYTNGGTGSICGDHDSKFIVDGVQVELNPRPDSCRARLGNEISKCFRNLQRKMLEDPELSINFSPTIEITTEELDTLDEKSKVFGCAPSINASEKSTSKITVDAATYRYRSAGGHIHLGRLENVVVNSFDKPDSLVDILDIIVGNTCVLIDRDEGNKKRREIYGRAGEYRLPSYGIEYRTLSNFWLRAYPLASFVFALSRMAVSIAEDPELAEEIHTFVSMDKIREAINENNFDLALDNFQKLKPFIESISSIDFPLCSEALPLFDIFVEKGLDFWFKENPLTHWTTLPEGHTCGWESFLYGRVAQETK